MNRVKEALTVLLMLLLAPVEFATMANAAEQQFAPLAPASRLTAPDKRSDASNERCCAYLGCLSRRVSLVRGMRA